MIGLRVCGGCTACCKSMPIRELNKSIGVWCRHCDVGVGCRAYADRPSSCRDFRCQWLMGVGEDIDRPDRVGIILDYVCHPESLLGELLQIWEAREGALDTSFSWGATHEALSSGIWVSHIPLRGNKKLFQLPNRVITPDIQYALVSEGFSLIVPRFTVV